MSCKGILFGLLIAALGISCLFLSLNKLLLLTICLPPSFIFLKPDFFYDLYFFSILILGYAWILNGLKIIFQIIIRSA